MVEEREDHVFFSSSFEPVVFGVAEEADDRFAFFLESVSGIQFDNLNRKELGPAVIHIDAAVIVDKNVGIPVGVAVQGGSLGPDPALGIDR